MKMIIFDDNFFLFCFWLPFARRAKILNCKNLISSIWIGEMFFFSVRLLPTCIWRSLLCENVGKIVRSKIEGQKSRDFNYIHSTESFVCARSHASVWDMCVPCVCSSTVTKCIKNRPPKKIASKSMVVHVAHDKIASISVVFCAFIILSTFGEFFSLFFLFGHSVMRA